MLSLIQPLYRFSEEKHERWKKAKRGTGAGADFLQWLTLRDVLSALDTIPGFGCMKCGRKVEVFSNVHRLAREAWELAPEVDAIDDLVPAGHDQTQEIARRLGITHPVDADTRYPLVLTVPMLIHMRGADGEPLVQPFLMASGTELTRFDNVGTLQILRRYCAEHPGWQPPCLITDHRNCISSTLQVNLELLRPHRQPQGEAFPGEFEGQCHSVLAAVLEAKRDTSVTAWTQAFDQARQWTAGVSITRFFHLIYTGRLKADVRLHDLRHQSVLHIAQASKGGAR